MADWRDVLLVDGYNMIGGWPHLAKLANSSMHEARDLLLEKLADYQAYSGLRVVVILTRTGSPAWEILHARQGAGVLRKRRKPPTSALSGLSASLAIDGVKFMWRPAI